MWSVISKIFTKNSGNNDDQSGQDVAVEDDRTGHGDDMDDTVVTKQAKQRASIKWLLSKAFNNIVPENLKEPFYRDHENQEHLKPQIVGALASAEVYCLALCNIYSDPNYHNLNHWAILQTLSRKGVYVSEPSDAQLTETTLIQTNPLRMSAHMAVIESIMVLYAKEVVSPDRVLAAIQRFSYGKYPAASLPDGHESGALLWMSHACDALRKRIEQELSGGSGGGAITNGGAGDRLKPPDFPPVRELKDLSDGVALAALISYYCPDELPWTELRVSSIPNVQDSLHNLTLVKDFCNRCLPALIFHLTPEDVTYLRDSMRQNLIVFLADLFNVIEIHPARCVRYPGMEKYNAEGFPPRNEHGVAHKRNLLQTVMTPIPDLRSGLDDPSVSNAFQVTRSTPTHVPLRKTNSLQQSQQSIVTDMSEDSLFRRGSEDSFVVHKGKNIPTLRSVVQDEPQAPVRHSKVVVNNNTFNVNKERQNNDSKADERGEIAAGRPSNWEENRKSSFAGRRSRRNSTSDDSQLTIENFGGSQDNLNFIGRNPDKEVGAHVGRKISTPTFPTEINPAVPVRSSLQDARGTLQLGYDNGCEKRDDETEKLKLKRQLSSDDISLRNILQSNKENINDVIDGEAVSNRLSSFAELTKQKMVGEYRGIQLVYMQHEKDDFAPKPKTGSAGTNGNAEKKTTFAALPNTTTWQQQSSNSQHHGEGGPGSGDPGGHSPNMVNPAQLNDVRMKLEEKRRLIESEKRRVEMAMNKQRQKVGKAAFLQAVAKGRGNLLKTPTDAESNSNSATGSESQSPTSEPANPSKPQRPFTLQEINDDASAVERKWLEDGQPYIETKRTPDLENMDLDQYQQSIAQMNSSLNDIQSDIQRLASQQSQIQVAQQQSLLAQQQKQIQALQQQQQYQSIQQQSQQQSHYQPPQQMYSPQIYQQPQQVYGSGLQSSSSAPHIPQTLYQQSRIQEQPQFFLHDQSNQTLPPPPVAPQRRTWAQQPQLPPMIAAAAQELPPQQPELRTWGKVQSPAAGFVLHDSPSDRYENSKYQQPLQQQHDYRYNMDNTKYQNGGEHNLHHSNSFTLSQQHLQQQQQQQQIPHHQFGTSHSTPSASPQHRSNIHRQISQLMDESKRSPVSLQQIDHDMSRKSSVTHAPIPAPSADDMEPQKLSFIGSASSSDDLLSEGLSKLNITSGSRTYRIPSPTRPVITRNSFQPSPPSGMAAGQEAAMAEVSSLDKDKDPTNKKGFYIQFDDDPPKRPKPPLRTKKMSPKKERSYVENDGETFRKREEPDTRTERRKQLEMELEEERKKEEVERKREALIQLEREKLRAKREASQENQKVVAASAIVIENDSNPDPDLAERMKKRILLASLQRKQEQEEAKAKKEQEAQARRDREKAKEEEKLRKKEEQVARRAAILEQYKMKKAMDEAEREGKVYDKSELMGSLKPTPKMRPKAASRPRPKTIHIDSGSVEMAEGMLQPSRGKKGSTSNLTANSMKRDYYRGSQDSLADRSMSSGMLYRDSPDDSRGMSPCHSANQTLGRRSSYKTSRDPSPAQVRGRPKYNSNYQNLKGRKSSSMMNLYGSSTDQDSLAYRYGDTDSGLGRATPPRRAPSPGMGSMRHLPSPSGPGSLPGMMSKGSRRMFDDGSSDISSTPSSMMDYNGPRLYKQPATKSNRGIMLNAVEYCVFPGVVNREAKRRVLEEINRSESKHFLILFRDAGCQFRALYSYCPDREEVTKMYGTGPKQVNDRMFDKFFKYNSGGKCFSVVHTKHLTVTIDAFTIHNSLWQGKKVNLPNKKDMALVI